MIWTFGPSAWEHHKAAGEDNDVCRSTVFYRNPGRDARAYTIRIKNFRIRVFFLTIEVL
jgi:hypothetical protein